MDFILSRRSIRKFKGDKVPEHILREILKAAMSAPSAGNQQPWHFIIIRERKILDEIPRFHQYSDSVKEAGCAILVCGDLMLEKHRGYWVQDCSAATQNILIAATVKGLGTCWLGVYPREVRMSGFRNLFSLPEHIVPFALVPIGYPAETKPRTNRYDDNRVHYDRW
jgi:nitroreductase